MPADPGIGLRFKVTIHGHYELGNWQKCDGLSIEYDIHEYREGGQNRYVHRLPGRAKSSIDQADAPGRWHVDERGDLAGSVQARLTRGTLVPPCSIWPARPLPSGTSPIVSMRWTGPTWT